MSTSTSENRGPTVGHNEESESDHGQLLRQKPSLDKDRKDVDTTVFSSKSTSTVHFSTGVYDGLPTVSLQDSSSSSFQASLRAGMMTKTEDAKTVMMTISDKKEGDPFDGTTNNNINAMRAMRGTVPSSQQHHTTTPYYGTSASRVRRLLDRIYGPDNASVRREIDKIENMSRRSQTGLPSDPNHIVPYKNHPFDVMRRRRERERRQKEGLLQPDDIDGEEEGSHGRRVQNDEQEEESVFKPIRIYFETQAMDNMRNGANGAKIDFIKNEILPRTRDFWSKALATVPVSGNLRISADDLANRQYCGDSEFSQVPANHISTGVPDVDIILYVSATPSTRFCGSSTLAVAVACNLDQNDRPIAGAINFCLDQIKLDEDGTASEAIIQDNVDVAIHEAAHVLGMSSNSYRYFYDSETGQPRTSRPFSSSSVTCVDGIQRTLVLPSESTMKFFMAPSGQRYASIVTPKVRTVARNQFNCQSLAGAQLENQPTGSQSCTGDHWDERLFYPEALSGVISPTTNFLSHLTLALMEDSGWYKANYTMGAASPWGLNATCDFVTEPCLISDPTTGEASVPSYGRGYFCDTASQRGCSPAHTHKMACTVVDYSLFFPQRLPDVQFQYFKSRPSMGGPRQADYCPLYGSTYSGAEPEQLDCRDPGNKDFINLFDEKFEPNSTCFETTSGEGRCYVSQCIYKDFVLKVEVGGNWYTCQYDFQPIQIEGVGGVIKTTLTCPRLSSVCQDMFCPFNCAGRGVCNYQSNVNGIIRPRCECFDESDTSPGCSDSLIPTGKYLDDSSGLLDNLEEGFFDPLVAVFVDHPDKWTTASWAWAAGLFVIFLLMILCICSSFWPQNESVRKRLSRRRDRYY